MNLTILSPRPPGMVFPPVVDGAAARAPERTTSGPPAPAGALAGKRIGFRVEWPSFHVFMEEMETILRTEHGVGDVRWWSLAKDNPHDEGGRSNRDRIAGLLDQLTELRDCVVLGLSN